MTDIVKIAVGSAVGAVAVVVLIVVMLCIIIIYHCRKRTKGKEGYSTQSANLSKLIRTNLLVYSSTYMLHLHRSSVCITHGTTVIFFVVS